MENNLEEIKNKVYDYFSNIEFAEEQHEYNYKSRKLDSVSNIVKNFYVPFNGSLIAGFVAKSRGLDREEVLLEWKLKGDSSALLGTKTHKFGEIIDINKEPNTAQEYAMIQFWKSIPEHIIPTFLELKMFHDGYGIAGTTDIILYNTQTNKFIVGDYKTNENLHKNYKGQKMLTPFDSYLDTPLNRYKVQLSLYELLFRQVGFEVESRKIIWLKQDGTFELFEVESLVEPLVIFLEKKKKEKVINKLKDC